MALVAAQLQPAPLRISPRLGAVETRRLELHEKLMKTSRQKLGQVWIDVDSGDSK